MKINDLKLLEFILLEDSTAHVTAKYELVADSLLERSGLGGDRGEFISNLKTKFRHPLDDEVREALKSLLKEVKKDPKNALYTNVDDVKALWSSLVEKAIISLRFFDNREPYQNHAKAPQAYGLDDLNKYFEKYADFEGLLYGSNKSYRDHVIHVFRTWMVGVYVLLRNDNGTKFIDKVANEVSFKDRAAPVETVIEGEGAATNAGQEIPRQREQENIFNFFEKMSMWTLIALCHDLGYPLEKAQKIFQKTNEMLEYFITNPKLSLDISFSGVQDYINDYIVRFLSSKMVERPSNDSAAEGFIYTGRVQPKFYIKYSKSLEKYSHGIVSSIILYKSLVYFLEAEFNVNEDYFYNREECKQYYLRREILRSISTHTCSDIYHLQSTSLSFLLILCDDLQEWDRKRWGDFYKSRNPEEREVELEELTENSIKIKEITKNLKKKELQTIIEIAYRQFEHYKKLFRDGQDTINRTFSFQKVFDLEIEGEPEAKYIVTFNVPKDSAGKFEVAYNSEIGTTTTFYKNIKEKFEVALSDDNKTVIFKGPAKP